METETTITWSQAFFGTVSTVSIMLFGENALKAFAIFLIGVGAGLGVASHVFPNHINVMVRVCGVVVILPCVFFILLCGFLSRMFVTHRQPPFKSAKVLLKERIQNGRAERREGYDLFLPPRNASNDGQKLGPIPIGLMLFPGALVDHTAYAPIAAGLSDDGIAVAVICLEPLRFATAGTGAGTADATRVMNDVSGFAGGGKGVKVSEWAMGGHSAGSSAAFNIVREMKPEVSKLVIWGGSSQEAKFGSLRDDAVQVLVVDASNDGLRRDWMFERFKLMLPPSEEVGVGSSPGTTSFVEIDGGNHSGFAHYGPQVFPVKDGERQIALEEQQKRCIRETADFLLGRSDKRKKE